MRGGVVVIAKSGDLGPAIVRMRRENVDLVVGAVTVFTAVKDIGRAAIDRAKGQALRVAMAYDQISGRAPAVFRKGLPGAGRPSVVMRITLPRWVSRICATPQGLVPALSRSPMVT